MCYIYMCSQNTRAFSTLVEYFTTSCATLNNTFKLFSSSAFVFEVVTGEEGVTAMTSQNVFFFGKDFNQLWKKRLPGSKLGAHFI